MFGRFAREIGETRVQVCFTGHGDGGSGLRDAGSLCGDGDFVDGPVEIGVGTEAGFEQGAGATAVGGTDFRADAEGEAEGVALPTELRPLRSGTLTKRLPSQ